MHDVLDESLAPAALGDDAEYAAFLAAQYAARLPVERWVAERDLPDAPPPQCHLIVDDLAALDTVVPAPTKSFELPANADPVGAYWALAGSALGNRAILNRRRKLGRSAPVRFLSDEAMPNYFKSLRPHLERSTTLVDARPAIRAAKAVFEQFLLTQDAVRLAA